VITKYNTNGNVIWAKGVNTGNSQPMAITTDDSANVIVLGSFQDHITIDTFNLFMTTGLSSQYFIVKMDSNGNVMWAKTSGAASTLGSFFSSVSGGADLLCWGGICVDYVGDIFVTGSYNADSTTIGYTTLYNHDATGSTNDIFVAGYSATGIPIWAQNLGGSGPDDVFGITVASTGNVYVAGMFASDTLISGAISIADTVGVQIAFVFQYSNSGFALWGTAAGGRNGAYAAGLANDHDGNVYITGSFGDSVISFCDTPIRQCYPQAAPNLEVYLVKLTDTNNISWHKTIGSPSCSLAGYTIARGNTETGALWVSGSWAYDSTSSFSLFFNDSVNVDGTIMYTPDSSTDPVFMAGYDLYGGVIGTAALQSGADDQNGIACDQYNNVYMCADYLSASGYTYFTVGPDLFLADTNLLGNEFQFLAKYGIVPPAHITPSGRLPIIIAPNPVTDQLQISGIVQHSYYSVIALTGNIVMRGELPIGTTTIPMHQLIPGFYTITITGDDGTLWMAKVIRE
jgi:hypothetical protein